MTQSILPYFYNQHQLEKELEMQKKLTRSILDFQDNLIFFMENDEIVEWNQAFSSLTGMNKNNLEMKNGKWLASFFVEDPDYFYPKDKENWIEEFLAMGNAVAKVRWKGHEGADRNYVMKASTLSDTKQLLFVCTDITELEKESRKNEQLSMMDPLTNTLNRMKFKDILTREMRRAEWFDHPFSIVLMDIDFFTAINDRFGPETGDKVLITISTILQQRIRECDLLARWGGEEFILLAPETDGDRAVDLAESIRTIIEEFQFKNIGLVTCSFGVTEFSPGITKSDLLHEAEQALNQSKNNGRNSVTLYRKDYQEIGRYV
ncbi:sensor domain-containing diguanylate cyclase [Neobacillus jeddahensis]|uniref:sensor domain-containing diguanylate cyclase n=1 Tax=Neobacillus jeddahensis TaxID=1461580 RepID=UPI00069380A4|nr:sensor domain-containing diguanylate cyclase [Neobacillus jeddahensis]